MLKNIKARFFVVTCVMITSLAVASCGIKPNDLKAPEGSSEQYPKSYPAPTK